MGGEYLYIYASSRPGYVLRATLEWLKVFGYGMFTGYIGSGSVLLSSILLEEKNTKSFMGRGRGREERRDMPKGFWICWAK